MIDTASVDVTFLAQRLADAEATVRALLSGEVDAVVDPRNNSPFLLGVAQRALRESERALRKTEAEYRQIVESTTDGIIKIDHIGSITFVNSRLAEMLGYTPAELIGVSLLDIVVSSELPVVRQSLTAREQGSTVTLDTLYRHKSGAEVAVNIAGSALRDDEGRFMGLLGFVRDVTERKKLQAQLIVSDRMASVGTLAAGVAHEINNPLAAVLANLEFVDESLTQWQSGEAIAHDSNWICERIAEPLRDAREAADRVRYIVRDLMIFSRSQADEPQVGVSVNAVLESSVRMGWNEIRHRADLVKDLGEVPFLTVNRARLGQVFLNLIVNAAQSLPVGHQGEHAISVRTYAEDGRAVIEVSDTGCGIAPDAIGRIFDAFYTTKEIGMGTGLGLAICQRIITDMNGTLTVKSKLGVGSTFRICLPTASKTVSAPSVMPVEKTAPQTGRILVVDDEEIVARVVQRSLGDSYEILTSTSAWAALALVEAGQTFDVILCDLMMPIMTGMELHAALLEHSPAQAQRMMFMTGGAFTDSAQEFVSRSDIAHIVKPFALEDIRNRLHEFVLESKQQESLITRS